jgi:hypothetical protein
VSVRKGPKPRPPTPPPGSNQGGGRRLGWRQLKTLAQVLEEIRQVYYWAKIGAKNPETGEVTKLDPNRANVLTTILRAGSSVLMHQDEMAMKMSDRSLLTRVQELEEQISEIEQLVVEKGLVRPEVGNLQ